MTWNESDKMNSNRKPYRLVPLSECILYKLYQAHVNDDDKSRYSLSDICEMFIENVSRNLVLTALDFLVGDTYDRGKPVKKFGKTGNHTYSITTYGILQVERSLNRRDSVAAYLYNRPDAFLDEIAGFEGIFYTPEERQDVESWSPLQIDYESPDFKETLKVLEESYEVIRSDNGFAAQYPAQREGILNSLDEGISWLKSKRPSPQLVSYLLINPLQWIASAFGKSALGEAGKRAAEKLIHFLSGFF
ncbi:hypothetical protein [Microvirga subterranea]|uniref:Uncharacterized protein n=1 Tax=Microvirga subterranea TaxID=186651 RepID=A0A370HL74_9HYPH|nr:hypothetical protein [Microvirga subterranea]RDI59187.1 hypothetical protein DES45_10498 [Microvirga subterranea]